MGDFGPADRSHDEPGAPSTYGPVPDRHAAGFGPVPYRARPARRVGLPGRRAATASLVLAGCAVGFAVFIGVSAEAWLALSMGAKGMVAWLKPRVYLALLCWVVPLCVAAVVCGVVSAVRSRSVPRGVPGRRASHLKVLFAVLVSGGLLATVVDLYRWLAAP